jgi:hypothetical protein
MRFTCIFLDEDAEQYYEFIVNANSADDVEGLCQRYLCEEAGDAMTEVDFAEYGTAIAVYAGDHPNMIVPDKGVEHVVLKPQ